jgi:hypothetical protein
MLALFTNQPASFERGGGESARTEARVLVRLTLRVRESKK